MSENESIVERISRLCTDAAEKNGWELNEDREQLGRVCAGLIRNFVLWGKPYCPCVIIKVVPEEKRKDYICPCVNAKEHIESKGKCKCMLFWKKHNGSV